jgi:glycosyltransferase involved in cell wall biosynthesis
LSRFLARPRIRLGWATAATLTAPRATFRGLLEASVAMRVAWNAREIERLDPDVLCELYVPNRRYDAVVFCKAMAGPAQAAAARVHALGGKVVFDANVNYYEIWGDYELDGTRPTAEQQRDAHAMTAVADLVIADSTYLRDVVAKVNPRVEWVPDNVDTDLFRPGRSRSRRDRVRLVWSGMSHKARPLRDLVPILERLDGFELLVVSNREPPELAALARVLPCRYEPFELRSYAELLRDCDVIISPKRLVNAYELAHTEWKITLGMAAGLPAVASPQRSYVEAVEADGGGAVVDSADDWERALAELRAAPHREELGERARKTVVERYSTRVVARRYLDTLRSLL